MSLETVISRRISIREFDLNTTVPSELVSEVLWAAYGYSWRGRTVPSLTGYPVIVYVSNETATYRFVPENQTLTLFKIGDYRELGLGGGWGYDAPIQLYIVLDTDIFPDILWGNADAGCAIQNIYLMANALNLGTVCTYPNRTDISQGLGLPVNEQVLYKMPLGYPSPPYAEYQNLVPTSRPSSPELPEIQDSNVSLEEALDSTFSSNDWSNGPVTSQELSQILWVSYGYSYYEDNATSPPTIHRTVPSADGYYPMIVYAADSSGVYEYLPKQHTLSTIATEDRRSSIAQATGNAQAASAPLIIAVAYNDTGQPYVGGETTYVEAGLITQNVYLECEVWGLIANLSRANMDEKAMKEALVIVNETTVHPMSIITVGHPSVYVHKAISDNTIFIVETKTNSTILNFAFDQQNRKISFDVSGPSDNIGFCNVTIPKMLLNGDFHVNIDGAITNYTLSQNDTHCALYFTYTQSTHHVEVSATDNTPPVIYTPTQVPPTSNVSSWQNVEVSANATDLESGVREVLLGYTTNNGLTWENETMLLNSTSKLYEGTILGQPFGTAVQYRITAYDNVGNVAVEDNAGEYYIYNVVPEFTPWIFLFQLFLGTALAVALVRTRKN
jgi:SagB-type dehydrogenase family enzyme